MKALKFTVNRKEAEQTLKYEAGPELGSWIIDIMKEQVREIRQHFSAKRGKGGWPLDYCQYRSELLRRLVGADSSSLFWAMLSDAGLRVCTKDGTLVINKKSRRKRKAAK